jgi:hypothetical protein
MKIVLIICVFLFFYQNSYAWLENNDSRIRKFIEKKYTQNKYEKMKKEISETKKILIKKNWKKENIELVDKLLKELDLKNEKYLSDISKVNQIFLWKSTEWNDIFAYYKWDIKKPFFWVFANIHWGYEYWSYLTANYLKDEFIKSGKTQWFIIPTINPDWLKVAEKDNFRKDFYIEWRDNGNGIELNRNFWTKDFVPYKYVKKEKTFYSWENKFSEKESIIIDNVLKTYHFSNIISLHSQWWILYIPDDSFYDKRIINLWNNIKNVLNDYIYFSPTWNKEIDEKNKSKIEINEGEVWKEKRFTGLMENYIYEKYDIPVVLIEISKHWKIEYKLKDLEF